MADSDILLKDTTQEIENMLTSKTVMGQPVEVQGYTLIPLLSIGFGFGAGGCNCEGEKKHDTQCKGAGTGGGGGARPIALAVINNDGVKIEPLPGSHSFGEAISNFSEIIYQEMAERKEKKQEGKNKMGCC